LCIERLGSVLVSPVTNYQALCRELTVVGTFGELSVAGARSVARRYCDAWSQAAKRRRDGTAAGFPRRKRALVPVRYPAEQIRAITLLAESGRLWLSVTAAVPVEVHQLNAELVGGVDLGIVCPYAVVAGDAGLLISGRAIRAENYLHLRDQRGTLRVSLIGCDRQACI
jgi:putative transposase